MALTTSELTLKISSTGIDKATADLKELAKAAASVDAETKAFVVSQAKLQAAQTSTSKTTKETSLELINQKRDYQTWAMAGSQMFLQQKRDVEMWKNGVVKAQEEASAALKQHSLTVKEYTDLWKQMDARKIAEQNQQYKLYTMEVARNNEVAKEAAKITKAHGDALEMNKKIDADRAKQLARSTAEQEKHNKSLEEGSRKGNVYVNTLRSMATAASAYIGVNFAKGLFESADAWSMMQSKLSLATGGMQSAKVVQEELYQMAQKIRIPLEDSAKLYNRLSYPLMMMGKTSKETTDTVAAMGFALKLSGATGQEASSAMLQFSQSMNAGRLNGGEFNSVAEASPNILRAIEAELVRTGRGAELAAKGLKKMAADGLLTAELVTNAMLKALPKWQKDFESLPLTVDGAMIRIKNSWEKAIGKLAQDTGFAQDFTKLLGQLEESIPSFAKALVTGFSTIIEYAGVVVKSLTAITAIGIATWAYESLWGAKGLIAGLNASQVALKAFGGAMAVMNSSTGVIGLVAAAMWGLYEVYQKLTAEQEKSRIEREKFSTDSKAYLNTILAEEEILLRQVNLLREKQGLKPYENRFDQKKQEDDVNAKISERTRLYNEQQKLYKEAIPLAEKLNATQARLSNPSQAAGYDAGVQKLGQLNALIKQHNDDITKVDKSIQASAMLRTEAVTRGRQIEHDLTLKQLNDMVQEKDKAEETYKKTVEFMKLKLDAGKITQEEYDKYEKKAAQLRDMTSKGGKESLRNAESERDAIKNLNVELQGLIRQKALIIKMGVDGDKLLPAQKKLIEMELDGSSKAQIAIQKKIVLAAQEKKAVEDSYEAIRKIGEDDKKRTDGMYEQNTAMASQLEILTRQLETEESLKQSKADQNVLEAERALSMLNASGAMGLEIALANERVRLAKELAAVNSKIEAKKELQDSKKFLDEMFDNTKVDKWSNGFSKGLTGISKGFSDMSKALDKFSAKQATISKAREEYSKIATSGTEDEIQLAARRTAIDEKEAEYKIASYGEMADAAKGFFAEGSRGYQTLDGISKVVHAAQMARNLIEMGQLAIKAVMNQANGDPYTAWGRMAAMAAVVAGLGFAVGGGFSSSGGGGAKAEDVQKSQGTGTVFGDSSAKSDSLTKSLEAMKKNFDKLYPVNVGMLNALKNIEKSMTGLTNIVFRTGITTDKMGIQEGKVSSGENFLTKVNSGWLPMETLLGGLVKFVSNLWGKTTQNIVDSGLSLGGSLSALKQGQGINQYASVDVTKSSWFGLKKSTTNQMQQQAVSGDISSQIGMIFSNMQSALEEAGKALYGKSDDVTKALEAMTLSTTKISLKGLSGQALTDALNAVISKGLDEMAGAAFKDFAKYQQVGEGLAATVLRVADNFATVNSILSKMNLTIFQMSTAGIDASLKLAELMGGLDELKSAASSYYENFFTEEERNAKTLEALKEQFKGMNQELPTSIKAYRALMEELSSKGMTEQVATMLKLSDAFAALYKSSSDSLDPLEAAKAAFENISKDAERWLNIRNQAASLKDTIDTALGNPKKDPAMRIKKLWDAMSSDISPEQKLTLATELKDLILDKYQVEKEGIQKLIDFGKQLRGYTDSLKLGNLSPLTTTQKLAEAQKQFQDTLTKAMGGDTTAQGALTGKADAYLQLAQTAYASSGAYTSIFENVTGALEALGLSSMSAEDKTLQLSQQQADELTKLRDYAAKMELLSDSYYKTNLSLLAEQTTALSKLYDKMGVFDGIATNLAALPAEIAANLSEIMKGNSSGDYITSLYNSIAGKSGSQIDKQGYDYWTNELNTYGREWVNRSFMESVKVVTGGGVAGVTTQNQNVEVVAQLAAVKEELVALRTEAAKQTGDLIVATYDANSANATAVVEGTTESLQASAWAANTTPSLI